MRLSTIFAGSFLLITTGCAPHRAPLTSAEGAPILLFNGAGTSRGDVAALESILNEKQLHYSTVNSSQLNRLDESALRPYRLLIIPGGNFINIGRGLSPGATATIRNAVQKGLNYLGICAGGFFAGDTGYNSLNLTSGVRFGFYSAEARGIRKTVVPISLVGGATLDQYWEDGPEFSGWGGAIAKYPDGTPAIVEGTFGSGRVILSGVHPEATQDWRREMMFTTPVTVDTEFAAKLIRSALDGTSLVPVSASTSR